MDDTAEDDELKLVKASANLLSDLEDSLPKVLYKAPKDGSRHGSLHSQVRQRDLDYIVKLIEPFQGEPQLLDARLRHIVPPIAEAFLQHLREPKRPHSSENVEFPNALSIILYTLCKVRGRKVIVGLFNNEPRHLECVLEALENADSNRYIWQTKYVLLLWLSHLVLTPFDLASISTDQKTIQSVNGVSFDQRLPNLATRISSLGLLHLTSSTLAQDAAASLLVRLAIRPDMQRLALADSLIEYALTTLRTIDSEARLNTYPYIGLMRFIAGIATSADLAHLTTRLYHTCETYTNEGRDSVLVSNAVFKKLLVKTLRNIAVLCLRSSAAYEPLQILLQTVGVLEEAIDFLLRCLSDRETPVRFAAAKAISIIVLGLDPAMGHEVIQAILDTFKEDKIRSTGTTDFQSANPLKWHGLTLTLAHVLFKRSASPGQMPDILNALIPALEFEQRTATGSSIGLNVRDAANFGLWALSRRYTTDELLSVDVAALQRNHGAQQPTSVIQALAIHLLQSACLDPVGNIRRGSSAALQELVGRHPNQIYEGISLVQIVEYQAVGLRTRAMIEEAGKAARLHPLYWEGLVQGLNSWRALAAVDVVSRKAAATSLAGLTDSANLTHRPFVSLMLLKVLRACPENDIERLHGLVLALALVLENSVTPQNEAIGQPHALEEFRDYWSTINDLGVLDMDLTTRTLQAELPVAIARLATALCRYEHAIHSANHTGALLPARIEAFVDRLLTRSEDSILVVIPPLVVALTDLGPLLRTSFRIADTPTLSRQLVTNRAKHTPYGAGRAFALGALAARCASESDQTQAVETLTSLSAAGNVDWRIFGFRAIQLMLIDLDQRAASHDFIKRGLDVITLDSIHHGLNDYTIDERGDIGSLVRLQAIACADTMFANPAFADSSSSVQTLQADILRLSLEKLSRVRLQAARCRRRLRPIDLFLVNSDEIEFKEYISEALSPLWDATVPSWVHRALVQGLISCAGLGPEGLLQHARQVLATNLLELSTDHLHSIMTVFASVVKDSLPNFLNLRPALELLAFMLDTQILQRLETTDFKWRNLLSTVQKAHYKSTDIPKILAAVHVYVGLGQIRNIRDEVIKKLFSMLKIHPYPKVRVAVAEVLFVLLREEALKSHDWSRPPSQNAGLLVEMSRRHLPG